MSNTADTKPSAEADVGPNDISSALSKYSSCEISDALMKLDNPYPHGGHVPDLLYYGRNAEQVKIVGPASTVKMVSANDDRAPRPEAHFVDAAAEGDIIVISAPSYTKNACWGGLMSAGAQAKGVRGVIIDGRCRDIGEHREMGFPVFARGHSTLGQGGFVRPSELNIPITISAHPPTIDSYNNVFPAVTVNPRDYIVADEDGVVVIQANDVQAVLTKCERNREIDAKCMADLKRGRPVAETLKAHRGR